MNEWVNEEKAPYKKAITIVNLCKTVIRVTTKAENSFK